MLSDRLCEHQMLIRHLATLQKRCTTTVSELHDTVRSLQTERDALHARLWAQQVRLVLQTTLLSWVGEAAEDPPSSSNPTSRHPPAPSRQQQALTAAKLVHKVICQTGCLSHGNHWRDGEQCRRTGHACDAVLPAQLVAQRPA